MEHDADADYQHLLADLNAVHATLNPPKQRQRGPRTAAQQEHQRRIRAGPSRVTHGAPDGEAQAGTASTRAPKRSRKRAAAPADSVTTVPESGNTEPSTLDPTSDPDQLPSEAQGLQGDPWEDLGSWGTDQDDPSSFSPSHSSGYTPTSSESSGSGSEEQSEDDFDQDDLQDLLASYLGSVGDLGGDLGDLGGDTEAGDHDLEDWEDVGGAAGAAAGSPGQRPLSPRTQQHTGRNSAALPAAGQQGLEGSQGIRGLLRGSMFRRATAAKVAEAQRSGNRVLSQHLPATSTAAATCNPVSPLQPQARPDVVPLDASPGVQAEATVSGGTDTAKGDDWFVELPLGAPLPRGRLGALYAALAANRALAGYLRDSLGPKVEAALDDNWNHMTQVKAAPQTLVALQKSQAEPNVAASHHQHHHHSGCGCVASAGLQQQADSCHSQRLCRHTNVLSKDKHDRAESHQQQGEVTSAHVFGMLLRGGLDQAELQDSAHDHHHHHHRQHRHHPDPSRHRLKALRGSRTWQLQGQEPEANADMLAMAQRLHHGFPHTYERVRWPPILTQRLKDGVKLEVMAHLTGLALEQQRSSAQAGLHTLTQEFNNIKDVDLDSVESQRIVTAFTDQNWANVSQHVKDRSAVDCKVYWLHSLRAQVPWTAAETTQLMALVDELGQQQWERVAQRLGTGRSSVQCLQAWVRNKRPEEHATRGRQMWTAEDHALLIRLAKQYKTKDGKHNWVAISKEFGNRFDRHQLRDRFAAQGKENRRTGRWSADEDLRLREALKSETAVDGTINWSAVAALVSTRTNQQCRERYNNVVREDLKKHPWAEREVAILNAAVAQSVRQSGRIVWAEVAKQLPGRTDDMCHRAYDQYTKFGKLTQWEGAENDGGRKGKGRGRNKRRRVAESESEEEVDRVPTSEEEEEYLSMSSESEDEEGGDQVEEALTETGGEEQEVVADEPQVVEAGKGQGAGRRRRGQGAAVRATRASRTAGRGRAAQAVVDGGPQAAGTGAGAGRVSGRPQRQRRANALLQHEYVGFQNTHAHFFEEAEDDGAESDVE